MFWNRTINVVDVHAEGEPGRVVVGGVLPPPGDSVFEMMCHMRDHDDWLRRFLLNEPRGAGISSANLVVPPRHAQADVGYIIMETVEYPAMSGSNTICTATVLLETGMIPMTEPETKFTMESPGGLIEITARCEGGRAREIAFTNQPAFVLALDATLEVEGLGSLTVDVAYGGMFFPIADAKALGFAVTRDEAKDLIATGLKITAAAVEQFEAIHPTNPGIRDVSITQIAAPLEDTPEGKRSRNVCVVKPGRLDRCPTGTGTCARLAVMHARGQIAEGEVFENHSIIDTRFRASVVGTTEVGGVPAVIPRVAGRGFVTGILQYGYDPADPFPEGYRLDDGSGG